MDKITSVSQLPDWFNKRTYGKQLSDIDWYREIRLRERAVDIQEIAQQMEISMSDFSCREAGSDLLESRVKDLSIENVRPDSLIYHISDRGNPVKEMSVLEANFLAFSSRASNASPLLECFDKLLTLWSNHLEEDNAKPENEKATLVPLEYELELDSFIDKIRDHSSLVHLNIDQSSEPLGNPFLSFGNVLNGHPLTIDTTFDDETILQHVKDWLQKKRATEKRNYPEIEQHKPQRPFNQNDFDDWETYKIREIFDLEYWAKLNNKDILDRVVSDAVWPHPPDEFSPIDVLRTTSRRNIKKVFNSETTLKLYGQLVLSYGEKFLTK